MIGKTISHFKILEKLGEGGMGVVYRAQDTKLGRDVAVKILPEKFQEDPDRLSRFKREAKLLASLNHPNIGAIYGLEEFEERQYFILELVKGETLTERIGQLDIPEALEICRQISDGLEMAHEHGIIHRDLKPSNIKITPDDKVKILDFGIAKALEVAEYGKESEIDLSTSPTLTVESSHPGIILGTASYMSPEQARGKPVDKKTDIWAFGCLLYELLTGKKAFSGETVSDSIASILKQEPNWEALSEKTPFKIRDLLRRCLQKDPKRRIHDIADARIVLEEAQGEGEEVTRVQNGAKVKKTFANRFGLLASYLILVFITVIVTWLILDRFVKSPGMSFPPNQIPVVVLMDSSVPNSVYDPETRTNRGTNADDLTDILRDLPIVIHKETTSSIWHREHQVLQQNPDLVVIHRSCFYDPTDLQDSNFRSNLYELAASKLISFLGYVAIGNPNTHFLVYSRGFASGVDPDAWRSDVEKRFPPLKGRMAIFPVQGMEDATFRNPKTASDIKRAVVSILDLAVETSHNNPNALK